MLIKGITSLRLKNCFAFTSDNDHVELIDEFGCPAKSSLISQFSYNDSNTAEALIYEIFKFPDSAKMYIQCDAILCRGGCQEPQCDSQSIKGRDLALDGYSQLSASTTVYVFEPSDESCESFKLLFKLFYELFQRKIWKIRLLTVVSNTKILICFEISDIRKSKGMYGMALPMAYHFMHMFSCFAIINAIIKYVYVFFTHLSMH